jgi:hypothetical protein
MADPNHSPFEREAPALFKKLEDAMKALNDAGYSAAVLEKGLADARSLLLAGNPAGAEQKYNDTKILADRAAASAAAEPLALRLLVVEAVYLLLLLFLGYVTHKWPAFRLWSGFLNLHSATAWFGALGGVTIGIYGLYSHIQARDFDPKFALWYICKPIMGAILGWFVFLVFLVGLVSVQGVADLGQVKNRLILYVIAFLAGFSERFTLKIIDRLMQILTTWQEGSAAPSGTPPKSK